MGLWSFHTYIHGVSERLQRVYKKYNIQTAMKPINTLKSVLVHPNDKIDQLQTCECVYEIPRKNCKKSYVGKTGRAFLVRLNEHKEGGRTNVKYEIHMDNQETLLTKFIGLQSQIMWHNKAMSSLGGGKSH